MYDDELDEDDLDYTINCLECGEPIYEDAVQCSHCGWFVVEEHHPWSNKPSWFRWIGVALILLVILAFAWPVVQFISQFWR